MLMIVADLLEAEPPPDLMSMILDTPDEEYPEEDEEDDEDEEQPFEDEELLEQLEDEAGKDWSLIWCCLDEQEDADEKWLLS